MAFKGYLIETQIAAKNVESYNRSAKSATVDFDGGAALTLAVGTDDCWVAATPVTGKLTGVWIAYNPSEWLTDVNGKLFAGLSADARDYTNLATRPFTAFKPQLGDVIALSAECFDASLDAQSVVGEYFEPKNAQNTWAVVASPTADHTAFIINKIYTLPFPQAGEVGMARQKMVLGECVVL